jgi:hypothetical protein
LPDTDIFSPEHKLARIRQAVVDLGRIAWADTTVHSDWPSEVYAFLGRAGVVLGIPDEEYQS